MSDSPRFLPLGDSALVVEFGDQIDPAINARVQALMAAIEVTGLTGIREMVPTFRSLAIHFNPYVTDHKALVDSIQGLNTDASDTVRGAKRWTFPFCADPEFAPDLADVAGATGLTSDAVLQTFCDSVLTVFFLGFVPGNAFLGQLPPVMNLSRRKEPRVRIRPGSVATAMGLGMIYPLESPGGWHLIGHSPVPLFDLSRHQPALLSPGDQVQFQMVPRADHDRLADDIAEGFDLDQLSEAVS